MSEVIVRMEMPKRCYDCDFADGLVCMATGGMFGKEVPKMTWIKTRPSWCPIVREIVPCDECVHSALASAGCCMYDSNVCVSGERSET